MAAPVLTYAAMNDLVATTLNELSEPNYTELTSDLQRYTAMRQLMRDKRRGVQSGPRVQWDIMVSDGGNAYNVGAGADDNVAINDQFIQGIADWRNSVVSFAWEAREIQMNSGKRRIVDLLKARRDGAYIAMVKLAEDNVWGPPVALSDTITPWGFNTWLPKSATAGFNGTVPSGYTTIGNVNPTTYPRWAGYTDQYTAITQDDLIRKWRSMAEYTDFEPPVDGLPTTSTSNDWAYYANYPTTQALEEVLMGQNEDLGTDVAPMDGKVMFRRTPIVVVPRLNSDTTNPIYSICWGDVSFYIFGDWWMKKTEIVNYPGKHTMGAAFYDSTYQMIFKNRRRSGVIATGTTYPA